MGFFAQIGLARPLERKPALRLRWLRKTSFLGYIRRSSSESLERRASWCCEQNLLNRAKNAHNCSSAFRFSARKACPTPPRMRVRTGQFSRTKRLTSHRHHEQQPLSIDRLSRGEAVLYFALFKKCEISKVQMTNGGGLKMARSLTM